MDALYWLTIGIVFLVIEVLSLTFFCLFLGITGIIMSFIVFIMPNLQVENQLIIASFLAVISVITGCYIHKNLRKSKHKALNINDRTSKYIGNLVFLKEDVKNGMSRVNLDGSEWKVLIEEGKTGDKVEITGINSTILIAKKL